MPTDYPAAHSMDTTWFAVDRDGYVAMFDSGEAGAVPEAASAQSDSVMDCVCEVVPRGEMLHDPLGHQPPGKDDQAPPRAWTAQYRVLMFLSSLDPLREAIARGAAVEVAATQGKAVLLQGISDEELERCQELPEFRGSHLVFFEDEGTEMAARYGVYEYQHLTENWISGPYGRERVPVQPLHIDQLPPALRESLLEVRLDGVRFADTAHIQPVEHTPCSSWEVAWLDVSGRHIRPLPGREEEYAEAYEEYFKGKTSFEVEPPETQE